MLWSGSALILLFWARIQEHEKVINKPEFQPFKKALVPMYGRYVLWVTVLPAPVPRVPQCLSPRPNWDPLHPFSRKRVLPPRNQRGERHTCLRVKGGPNSDDWRKSLTLLLFWGITYIKYISCENLTFLCRLSMTRIRIRMDPHWSGFLYPDLQWGQSWIQIGSALKPRRIRNIGYCGTQ